MTLTDVFSKNGKELDKQLVLKDEEGNIYNGEAFTLAYEGEANIHSGIYNSGKYERGHKILQCCNSNIW